jgi:hypothetical protein
MTKLKIYIPSRGRPHNQITANTLIEAGVEFIIATSPDDDSDYSKYPTTSIPSSHIGEKRQGILERGGSRILMLDDDLRFRKRTPDNKFIAADGEAVREMIEQIDEHLDRFAHVGIVDEFMSCYAPRNVRYGGRYNQVVAYNQELFPAPPP